MAQVTIPLNATEKQILIDAFTIYMNTQIRASNNATNAGVKAAFKQSANEIEACKVKLLAFVA